ncbi:fungal-specific transcription factor domain-containing protein [Penicillium frequentans]|nr:fungal-specific transcription factor domain-containing protein [Penicillium glabrum]
MDFMRGKSRLDLARHISMFAIYYTSVITMSGKECWEELHETKEAALKGFRDELENSLEQSGFLNTSDLTVIQSFVLYTVCGRFDKRGPDTNRLKDVAIRLAFQNNLHRDGLEFNMAPFEVEIRRRLWWQICVLDVRTAEDNGSDPQILTTSFTTRFPSNVNDSSLHPGMSEMPQAFSGRTEMSFTLVRFEGSNFARRVVFSDKFCQENSYDVLSGLGKCVAINNFRDEIEEKYLSHLDKSVPLDFITAASIRLILVKLKLAVNKPQTRQSQHLVMQQSFRKTCVEILQRARLLRHYEMGKQWLWLFQTYLEWDALSYLFINLSLVPSGDDVDLAWGAVDDIYDYWKDHSDACLDHRWKDIEDLRSRALYARGLVQREPSVFAMSPVGSCDSNPFDRNTQVQSAPISHAEVVSTALQEEGITESLTIPSAGTGCQWSAQIFEKYFEVLDSEHNLHRSWL